MTYSEYKKFVNHHTKKFKIFYYLFAFLVGLVIAPLTVSGHVVLVFIYMLIIASLVLGLSVLILNGMLAFRSKREFKSDKLIQSEITYDVSTEGVHQQVKRMSSFFEWSDFLKVQELEHMFLLYLSKNKAVVLPKRHFQTWDDINLFRDFVAAHVVSSKLK